MSSPKKKLPTGPIRIDAPVAKRVALPDESEPSNLHPMETESSRQIRENRKQDSDNLETSNQESSNLDSGREENSNQQATRGRGATQQEPELEIEEYRMASSSISPGITESGIPDSGITFPEYKKVAMRLSVEAVESLRQLRATTGVPYEILVDVMIRNWDNLPKRTQAVYLQQAKQARVERLIAGQEKTVKTMRAKYLEQ